MKKLVHILVALAIPLALSACNGNYQSGDFTADYRQALQAHTGAPVKQAWVENFTRTYGDFTGARLEERMRELYAPELFFNDTVHSYRQRSELIAYLEKTSERLEAMSLEVLDTRISGRDLYLRWIMRTDFQASFREVSSETIGMSHLRFNEDGKVILHQDFWDSRQGIFEHIPVVGGLIKWIRNGL